MAPTRKAKANKKKETLKKETLKIQPVIKAIGKKPIDKKNTRKVAVIVPPRERLERGAKSDANKKIREITIYEKISSPPPTPVSSPLLMTVKIPSPKSLPVETPALAVKSAPAVILPAAKSLSTTKTPAPEKSLVTTKTKGKTVTFKSSPKPNSIYKEWADKIFNWREDEGQGLRSGKVMGKILTLDPNETADSIADFLMRQPQEKGTDQNCLITLLERYKNYPFLTPTEIYVRYKKIMTGKEQSATKSISITPEQACSMVEAKIIEIYGNAIANWGTNFSYRAKDKKQGTKIFNEKYSKMKYLGGGSSSSKQKTRRTTQRPRTTQRHRTTQRPRKTLKNKHNKTHQQR
jgi:hypothetical protein